MMLFGKGSCAGASVDVARGSNRRRVGGRRANLLVARLWSWVRHWVRADHVTSQSLDFDNDTAACQSDVATLKVDFHDAGGLLSSFGSSEAKGIRIPSHPMPEYWDKSVVVIVIIVWSRRRRVVNNECGPTSESDRARGRQVEARWMVRATSNNLRCEGTGRRAGNFSLWNWTRRVEECDRLERRRSSNRITLLKATASGGASPR